MSLYPTGGEAATLALVYCVLSWAVGILYGSYLAEKHGQDRSLYELWKGEQRHE
ncbi:hypothetical protein [Haloarcula halophila]|uniref:hypothetical protein n=1 Tax=Haloarcula TaxID=2237 RepID=UPI0023E3BC4F|nr:hypothetical protein [Halomicroarcula sp. DFY41]